MIHQSSFYRLALLPLYCLLGVWRSAFSENRTIVTKMCDNFCSKRDKNCVVFGTPVGPCYNGQALFPHDPSWGEYDITDNVVDSTSFIRIFYLSVDASCQNSSDTFTLPFDECIGPFGQPYPWGKFTLAQSDNDIKSS